MDVVYFLAKVSIFPHPIIIFHIFLLTPPLQHGSTSNSLSNLIDIAGRMMSLGCAGVAKRTVLMDDGCGIAKSMLSAC